MATFFLVVTVFLPWKLRRFILVKFFEYDIHPTAFIGRSIVLTKTLTMKAGSMIGHMTLFKGLDSVFLGEKSFIGNLNWITAFPSGTTTQHFAQQQDRKPTLYLAAESAITNRHLIDCTASVTIGRFSTFAGFRSQILTHSIDVSINRQVAKPVTIGEYCFVGTGSIILSGSKLPSFSILGAGSVLNKKFDEPHFLYAGAPAKPIKELSQKSAYFNRKNGYVI